MASLHKKRIRNRVYWYARECRRVDGKPTIVWQKYLGRADDIVAAVEGAQAPQPATVRTLEFGASVALFDLLQRLDVIGIIDRHIPKRGRGPSVGQYLAVAAINRCIAPTSKNGIADWFGRSMLSRLMSLKAEQLTSQRFWDNMDRVSESAIAAIEEELTRQVVKQCDLDLTHLLFDATNFFTFIDSFNRRADLPQRGKSKEGRAALRIVGLALLVTADFHVPLLHHTYAGNQTDAPTFASLTDRLLARYRSICQQAEHVTLVFDKGNNSAENLAQLKDTPFNVVGSLLNTQHADLLEVPLEKFRDLDDDGLPGVSAYRAQRQVFGVQRTVLVTYNTKLFLAQTQTISREVAKRTGKLRDLQQRLRARREGRIKGGRAPTLASVQKQVDQCLKGQHMKTLIHVDVHEREKLPWLTYRFDQRAWQRLQRTTLGKTLLFTDNDDWTDAQIIRAYRGQSKIEDAFRCLKDTHHLALRPTYHWTDQKIRVQVFICVLALTLVSLLQRHLDQRQIPVSVARMLDLLADIQHCTVVYPPRTDDGEPLLRTSLSDCSQEQRQLYEALELQKYQNV